ncbi:MAG: tetratricopeptide repeat protein, partial [Rhodospirillales bacterium]|nr:tetratricopeptide repeat protein [Rhodospirillales bacterium]
MGEERSKRRLAAILAADVVGYSRLMEADEAGTLAALKAWRGDVLKPLVARHRGRIFKLMGDGVLVEFGSAVNAVQCAVDLQRDTAAVSADLPEDRRIVLRIGVSLGDVMVEGADLYGDGVNIAARLEGIAEPGGILVSGAAYDQVRNKISVGFEDLGAQTLKNIAEPVRAYRVAGLPTVAVSAPKPRTANPSIAVLPFVNMSGDPEQEYFSDGITEDIITELSRFRHLHVIARNSSFQFRGKDIDVKRIGRELGVQYLVEGSVRRVGDRIRITAQLIDTIADSHLWAERYDRDARDILALQEEVAHAVAATAGGRVDAAGRERAMRLSPAALRAYDLVLRAKALVLRHSRADNEQARLCAEKAIELDPTSSRAHAWLAMSRFYEYMAYWTDTREASLREAYELAQRAVLLDESDSLACVMLGFMHLGRRNFDEARSELEKAIDLNPNDSEARGIYAFFLTAIGRPDAAIEQFDLAKRQNPYDMTYTPWIKGIVYFTAHRYDDA